MLSLREHFVQLQTNIQPKENRAALARDLPDNLRDYLQGTDKIATVSPHSRLSGSYARNTAIKTIKDVDILLFVEPDCKTEKDSAAIIIDKLVNALQGLPRALEDGNGYVDAELALKRQRRSVQVHVTVAGQDFSMDVVPAIAEDGLGKALLVPDRHLSKWISSDPLGYNQSLSNLNKECYGKIVPLDKMFKHWRDAQMKRRRPKSYWLECMVHQYANEDQLATKDASYGELFFSLLKAVLEDLGDAWRSDGSVPTIVDPMLKNNVAGSWTRDEFDAFMRRIEESRRIADRALSTDDEQQAIKLWQRLFNDDDGVEYFPSTIEETLAAALSGGALFVASSGRVLSHPSSIEKSWGSPPHQNYGDNDETSAH